VPSMFNDLGVGVPYTTWWGWSVSEAQGQHREVLSEGSVEQNRDSTNRNRIRGSAGGTSGQKATKSIPIKRLGC